MSSKVNFVKRGKTIGKGTAKKIVLGFKPVKVELFNETGLAQAFKTDTMETSKAIKQITAGTMTFPANVCTIETDGFTIGTDTDINVASEVIHWVAYEAIND